MREEIGRKMAAIRNSQGLTIRQLAELSGVSAQNITKIEHGRYNVSIDILAKICNAMNVEINIM